MINKYILVLSFDIKQNLVMFRRFLFAPQNYQFKNSTVPNGPIDQDYNPQYHERALTCHKSIIEKTKKQSSLLPNLFQRPSIASITSTKNLGHFSISQSPGMCRSFPFRLFSTKSQALQECHHCLGEDWNSTVTWRSKRLVVMACIIGNLY